jgi:hypothetical protein
MNIALNAVPDHGIPHLGTKVRIWIGTGRIRHARADS